jgi:hypothetical protein
LNLNLPISHIMDTVFGTWHASDALRTGFLWPLVNTLNRFDQRVARQHLCKHGPTRNNRWGCVFYVVRAEQRWNNGVMHPFLNNGSVNTFPRKRWCQQQQRRWKHEILSSFLCNSPISPAVRSVVSLFTRSQVFDVTEYQ